MILIQSTTQQRWSSWCAELVKTKCIQIPSCYLHEVVGDPLNYQLHGFCDSSQTGYAAVVYIQIKYGNGIYSEFVTFKTRVTPLTKQSIPRLELLSALILSRLITTMMKALESLVEIDKVQCWTDSLAALYWIRGMDKEWKMFVENRVQ